MYICININLYKYIYIQCTHIHTYINIQKYKDIHTYIYTGIHSKDIDREDYLRYVSVVRQSPSLFTDTIANNIGM
jgi:ABC-type transport system involved in cytochrome bd biosynthesis fused ATPase/permease subunit